MLELLLNYSKVCLNLKMCNNCKNKHKPDIYWVLIVSDKMASPKRENYRMKSYKNKALNPQEMRRRREEEGVQLRKQKREEQVNTKTSLQLELPLKVSVGHLLPALFHVHFLRIDGLLKDF